MSVKKRKTTAGETTNFHYRFTMNRKLYQGVCKGCKTEEEAKIFEAKVKKSKSKRKPETYQQLSLRYSELMKKHIEILKRFEKLEEAYNDLLTKPFLK